jgi:hypothetical protein
MIYAEIDRRVTHPIVTRLCPTVNPAANHRVVSGKAPDGEIRRKSHSPHTLRQRGGHNRVSGAIAFLEYACDTAHRTSEPRAGTWVTSNQSVESLSTLSPTLSCPAFGDA